jgi:hypothetical protein
MNYATQLHAHAAADAARARATYVMGCGTWSIPSNSTFGLKPRPRWSQVKIS